MNEESRAAVGYSATGQATSDVQPYDSVPAVGLVWERQHWRGVFRGPASLRNFVARGRSASGAVAPMNLPVAYLL